MGLDDKLLALARERDASFDAAIRELAIEAPHVLRSQMRAYLATQVDLHRIPRTNEGWIEQRTGTGGIEQLICPKVEFVSEARLEFKVELVSHMHRWLVQRFQSTYFSRPEGSSGWFGFTSMNGGATMRYACPVPYAHR